jgi:hypothetical protein
MYTDRDDPDQVMLLEKWATSENYDAYLAWRIEAGLMEAPRRSWIQKLFESSVSNLRTEPETWTERRRQRPRTAGSEAHL